MDWDIQGLTTKRIRDPFATFNQAPMDVLSMNIASNVRLHPNVFGKFVTTSCLASSIAFGFCVTRVLFTKPKLD